MWPPRGRRVDAAWTPCGRLPQVSLIWGLNLFTGMLAMQHASLGLVMVMRNLAPLITFVIECVFLETVPMTAPAIAALVLMTSGVALYIYNDLTFTWDGFLLNLLDVFVGIGSTLMQRRLLALKPVDISFTGTLAHPSTAPDPNSAPAPLAPAPPRP